MGTVSRFFYSNEGDEPAHVAINTGFAAHEIGDIIRYLRQNRSLLLSAWNEHFGA
jgi:hypothetical protein